MTLPESVPVEVDALHEQIFEEEMDEDARENIREFIEGDLRDRVGQLTEQAIYKRYQQGKQE